MSKTIMVFGREVKLKKLTKAQRGATLIVERSLKFPYEWTYQSGRDHMGSQRSYASTQAQREHLAAWQQAWLAAHAPAHERILVVLVRSSNAGLFRPDADGYLHHITIDDLPGGRDGALARLLWDSRIATIEYALNNPGYA